jgi:propionate CoA-transferase
MAQVDLQGNVNVSKFGEKLAGAGGFVNISQATRKIVFMGSFRAGASQCDIAEESLAIRTEGETSKFVEKVAHITFSGERAIRSGQEVLFVTERCVFRLIEQGLELREVAPGVDVERDILRLMDFRPIVRETKRMDAAIFRRERIGLRERLLTVPIEQRLTYVPLKNTIFINLEGHNIKGTADIEELRAGIVHLLEPLGTKVFAIVNYDHFNIAPEAIEEFADMIEALVARYYLAVTRYTTSGFLRAKLGDALSARRVAPHIFERAAEAEEMLKQSRTGNATS